MEDYLRAAIWPGAPVIDDPEGLLGEKVNRLYMFSHEPITVTAKEEIFSRKAFTAALLGELGEENDWGLPVTPEGKMEERKRKCAADVYSVVK